MNVLIDTNILCRLALPGHPFHALTLASLDSLKARYDQICIVPQNLYEFWVVCTRPPADNGIGMTPEAAEKELAKARFLFVLLPDEPDLLDEWEQLVTKYAVRGKRAHDTRLVAAMKVHGISHILTFNPQDFARYDAITVLTPEQIIDRS